MPHGPPPLHALCRDLVGELDASACAISRVVGELLVQLAEHTTRGRSLIVGQGYLVPDFPLTAQVLESGRPVALSLEDADVDPAEAALLRELGYESLLMLTLEVGGAPWALVEVYGDEGRRFDEADVERAERIVARVAAEAFG